MPETCSLGDVIQSTEDLKTAIEEHQSKDRIAELAAHHEVLFERFMASGPPTRELDAYRQNAETMISYLRNVPGSH